jgi:phosphoribosylglycinamide formyltransferase-1
VSGKPLAVAVLISGTGSNLKALISARDAGKLNLDFRLVISNRKQAPGLDHARQAGIPVHIIGPGSRHEQDMEIKSSLEACGAELIILAGYMRIIGAELVNAFAGQLINLHPSLLPLYPGLHTYQKAIDAGDTEHGSSIHFVTAELDGGPVISQVRIPVRENDRPETLSDRLGPEEHRLLLSTVELFVNRRVKAVAGTVQLDGKPLNKPLLLNPGDTFD